MEHKLNNVRFQLDFGMIPKIFYKDPLDFVLRSRRVKEEFICALFNRYYETLNPMYFPENPKHFSPADFAFRELTGEKGTHYQIITLPREHEGSLEYCTQFIIVWKKAMFKKTLYRLYAIERTPLGLLSLGAMEPDGTHTTLGAAGTEEENLSRIAAHAFAK